MPNITIIDSGIGNIGSVSNMLTKANAPHSVSNDPEIIASSRKLILPGVGAFDAGILRLKNTGIWSAIEYAVYKGDSKLLGICLGMQLLCADSEEGSLEGFGFVPTTVKRFRFSSGAKEGRFPLRVPHMSWRDVTQVRVDSLMDKIVDPRFYFVHSFFVPPALESTFLEATHGHSFSAGIRVGEVAGVQFHPEKSHLFGLKLLSNFAKEE